MAHILSQKSHILGCRFMKIYMDYTQTHPVITHNKKVTFTLNASQHTKALTHTHNCAIQIKN